MKDIVVLQTMEDIDKKGDCVTDLEEYIGDMYNQHGGGEEPEWVKTEREHFVTFRDKKCEEKWTRMRPKIGSSRWTMIMLRMNLVISYMSQTKIKMEGTPKKKLLTNMTYLWAARPQIQVKPE
ncbi:hypothetical protein NDU88_005108 [Pleurodeles waltl]|uniref:Uncharacterized protein n=1 Tax=Pleurodeles waltl TaxID=8319 RepID=A0AAV7VKZ9_PLEWA|nr:hypothetical protein NDU88_005108 [Pleurodeles waltl]